MDARRVAHGDVCVCAAAAGRYKGIPVSIITTLMGTPNMDFMVRESRAVVEGQMAVTRLGTCGILLPDVKVPPPHPPRRLPPGQLVRHYLHLSLGSTTEGLSGKQSGTKSHEGVIP